MLRKMALLFFLVFLATLGMFYYYFMIVMPKVAPAPEVYVSSDSLHIARGAYLANSVMVCFSCHGERDWSKFSGPEIKGSKGATGPLFGYEKGLPAQLYPANLTPDHLADWTDGEILWALAAGVNKEGEALFPMMPYEHYRTLDQQDLLAVVGYLRTLPSIKSENKASKVNFPLNYFMKSVPTTPEFKAKPEETDRVAYGKYLVTAAACSKCHTPQKGGAYDLENAFAGGFPLPLTNGGTVFSSNITPDSVSGIGQWSKEYFVSTFKSFQDKSKHHGVAPGQYNTEMPWSYYANMSESDLEAIYIYLRTLKPISKNNIKFLQD